MIAFGPVVSRRLGYSLGINHVPPKYCSYACVYCQVGRTSHLTVTRQAFYPPQEIVSAVGEKLAAVRAEGKTVDTLTFVPDGEPGLDLHLAESIQALRQFGLPIAIISNASLLADPQVRQAFLLADWVSLKMDAVDAAIWRKVNRPHGHLDLAKILAGALAFRQEFKGKLLTETMLVAGVNDSPAHLTRLAQTLKELAPQTAYLAVPFRPPAEDWVQVPSAETIQQAYHIFRQQLPHVELMLPAEPDPFVTVGSLAESLLSTSAVHPLDEDSVRKMAAQAGEDWTVVEELVQQGKLRAVPRDGTTYYLRAVGRE